MSPLQSFLGAALLAIPALSATFTLTASLAGSTLDGEVINASGLGLYLGLANPLTFCPITPPSSCPAGKKTVLASMNGMWVEVPGGQQAYVQANGALGYTVAHSATIPLGAYIGGWTGTNVTDCEGVTSTLFNFLAPNATEGGVAACPNPDPSPNEPTYQIYAITPAFNQTNCVELDGLLANYQPTNDFGAWEYT